MWDAYRNDYPLSPSEDVTGVCGAADGTPVLDDCPVFSLCEAGVASAVTEGASTCTWTCTGTDTVPDNCSAAISESGNAVFEWDSTTYSVNESVGTATFTINRTVDTTGAGSVDWGTYGSTASTPDDYTGVAWTTVNFADGESSKNVSVTIIDDSEIEGTETFAIHLNNAVNGTLGTDYISVVTIVDDDSGTDTTAPTVSSAAISTDGLVVGITFDEPVTATEYNIGDFYINCDSGSNNNLATSQGTGTYYELITTRTVYGGTVCTLSYIGSGVTDTAVIPNSLDTFSGMPMTNNSIAHPTNTFSGQVSFGGSP